MGNYNKDELTAPSWMGEPFFRDILRNCEKDDSVLITELKITPATMKGDHFASVMFRATILYDTSESKGNSKSMIIKTMPESDGIKKEMLAESHVFETEIEMYSKTIPKFEAELRKVGDNTVLGARVLYFSLKPRKCIIFEDIVPLGYETIRNRLLSETEAKTALVKLAKWHAVSYKLAAVGDDSVTAYREGFLNMKNVEEMPFIRDGIEHFIATVEQIDELKMCLPKLRTIRNDLVKSCIQSFNTYRQKGPKEGVFVLCHGDFHSKNLMFKTNDKSELQDVMLLDFQLCYFGPAVLDVIYGIYMLIGEDERRDHRDELIHFYYTQFIKTLENLKFQGEYPKCADYMIEIIKHRHWELYLLASLLPFVYAATGTMEGELEDVITSNDAYLKLYNNPDYLKEVKRVLPRMLRQGYLE